MKSVYGFSQGNCNFIFFFFKGFAYLPNTKCQSSNPVIIKCQEICLSKYVKICISLTYWTNAECHPEAYINLIMEVVKPMLISIL